jgi:pimeloyl-ACP methyl ester carboxylesterase
MADKLRATIPGAQYVEIPGAYHHLTLDNPKAFVRAVDPFLTTMLG